MFATQAHPKDVAAIIVEPILGEGGMLTPPPGFLAALRSICDEHGILLVADEVQSGAGRTGEWWAHEAIDGGAMRPDLMVFAKGIASGYPLAGVAAREELTARLAPGVLGGTYGGNAVACAAAVATIEVRGEGGDGLCVCRVLGGKRGGAPPLGGGMVAHSHNTHARCQNR